MAIVGIYKIALTNAKLGLTKEVMANKVRFTFVYCINIGFCIGCGANFLNIVNNLERSFVPRIFSVLQIGYILMPVRIRLLIQILLFLGSNGNISCVFLDKIS